MKVALLKRYFKIYEDYLADGGEIIDLHVWKIQNSFQDNWDSDFLNFGEMYDKSLVSDHTQRVWKREDYYPKQVILKMIDHDREMMRVIFQDLLNEKKDYVLRINRFLFHLDQMLAILQKKDRKIASHFHSDLEMLSHYLAFATPENHSPYFKSEFNVFLKKVESKKIPVDSDLDQFFKFAKAIKILMLKEGSLIETQKDRLMKEGINTHHPNLWVSSFYRFVAAADN